eukprot:gene7991-5551_t
MALRGHGTACLEEGCVDRDLHPQRSTQVLLIQKGMVSAFSPRVILQSFGGGISSSRSPLPLLEKYQELHVQWMNCYPGKRLSEGCYYCTEGGERDHTSFMHRCIHHLSLSLSLTHTHSLSFFFVKGSRRLGSSYSWPSLEFVPLYHKDTSRLRMRPRSASATAAAAAAAAEWRTISRTAHNSHDGGNGLVRICDSSATTAPAASRPVRAKSYRSEPQGQEEGRRRGKVNQVHYTAEYYRMIIKRRNIYIYIYIIYIYIYTIPYEPSSPPPHFLAALPRGNKKYTHTKQTNKLATTTKQIGMATNRTIAMAVSSAEGSAIRGYIQCISIAALNVDMMMMMMRFLFGDYNRLVSVSVCRRTEEEAKTSSLPPPPGVAARTKNDQGSCDSREQTARQHWCHTTSARRQREVNGPGVDWRRERRKDGSTYPPWNGASQGAPGLELHYRFDGPAVSASHISPPAASSSSPSPPFRSWGEEGIVST